jgi:hypothetical protein
MTSSTPVIFKNINKTFKDRIDKKANQYLDFICFLQISYFNEGVLHCSLSL